MNTMRITHYKTNLSPNEIVASRKSDLPNILETHVSGHLISENGSKPLTISIAAHAISDFKKYLSLSERVESFNHLDTTKNSDGVKFLERNIQKVAEQGFYYTPTKDSPDRVRCIMCLGIIYDWEENDVPSTEHSKYFPKCSGVINGIHEFSFESHEVPQAEAMMPDHSMHPELNAPSYSKQQKSTFDQYPENKFEQEPSDEDNKIVSEARLLSAAIYPAIDTECNEHTYISEKRRDFNKCLNRYFSAVHNYFYFQAKEQISRLKKMQKDMTLEDFVNDDDSKISVKEKCLELLMEHGIQPTETSDSLYKEEMYELIDCINNSNQQFYTDEIDQLKNQRIFQELIILVLNAYEENGIKMKRAIEDLQHTEDELISIASHHIDAKVRNINMQNPNLNSQKIQLKNASIGIPLNPSLGNNLISFTDYESRIKALKYKIVHKELNAMGIVPRHLAEAGFFPSLYALDNKHSYQCFACAGKLSLKLGDNVFIDHAKYFPECLMVHKIGSDYPTDLTKDRNPDDIVF